MKALLVTAYMVLMLLYIVYIRYFDLIGINIILHIFILWIVDVNTQTPHPEVVAIAILKRVTILSFSQGYQSCNLRPKVSFIRPKEAC